jgi:hypothetical protein
MRTILAVTAAVLELGLVEVATSGARARSTTT